MKQFFRVCRTMTYSIAFLAFFGGILLHPASTQAQFLTDRDAVAFVGGEPITQSEVRRFYTQNYPSETAHKDSLRSFLKDYVIFRAKLFEAEQMGLDQDPAYNEEVSSFAETTAPSYWIEKGIKNEMIDRFLDKRTSELKVQHLLIRLRQDATVRQLNEASQTLMLAKEQWSNGVPFDSLNNAISSKVNGRPAGGELPWFSAGATVIDFEDAAYGLPVGTISEPIRTQFGLHLIKVLDRRPAHPAREVSHVFFRDAEADSSQIVEAMQALDNGTPWSEVVQQYSAAANPASPNGTMGFVGYNMRYADSFVDLVMNLDPNKSYEGPFESQYGVHILRLDSVRQYESQQQKREDAIATLERLAYFQIEEEDIDNRLLRTDFVQKNKDVLASFNQWLLEGEGQALDEIELTEPLSSDVLVEVDHPRFPEFDVPSLALTTSDYIDWMIQQKGAVNPSNVSPTWLDEYIKEYLRPYLIPMTRIQFDDFNTSLLQYEQGLLVFNYNDQALWNPSYADTAAVQAYYETHRDAYQYDTRYHYTLLSHPQDSTLKNAVSEFEQGYSIADLTEQFENLYAVEDSTQFVESLPWAELPTLNPGEGMYDVKIQGKPAWIYLHDILSPRNMTFEEAFMQAFNDMQPDLEKSLEAYLTQKYDIKMRPRRIR
ncbi:MAG: peptidylprolyl isomerase [Balneolaceae bacterium]|nr:peptidylprolyl isomerase [Balneolaceae bacterium]